VKKTVGPGRLEIRGQRTKTTLVDCEEKRESSRQAAMAMRDLVTGGAACAVPGSSSASNPLGALANALIGSSSKTQVHNFSFSLGALGCRSSLISKFQCLPLPLLQLCFEIYNLIFCV